MAKHTKYQRQVEERPWQVHPIWRGIGCILLIIIPLMSYAGAVLLVQANLEKRWVEVPWELMGAQSIPVIGITVENLYANLALAVILSILCFGVVMLVYTIAYSAMGPPRYGPLDSPPVRKSGKRRR